MRRAAIAIIAVLLVLLLGACGGSDDPPAAGSGGSAAATSAAPADDVDDAPAAEATDPCTTLTADEVGAALGGTVTLEEQPGGGCGFDQEDPRAPSVGIFAVSGAGGGFEESKQGNVLDGDVEDLPGVGDGAWLAVGTSGGDNQQGQGVVALGDQLVNVALTQGNGLDAATVRKMVADVLTLVASKG